MIKSLLKYGFIALAFVIASCKTSGQETTETKVNASKQEVVGTWDWVKVLNMQTNQEMSVQDLEGINAEEIKTEFKRDNKYAEYKRREGSTDFNVHEGEWKLEDGNKISTRSQEDWKTTKIVKLSEDSLYLQIQEPIVIVMAREEIRTRN